MRHIDLGKELKGLGAEDRFIRYREIWRAASRFEVLTLFPMHLDIELSGICNLRCPHCFQNGMIEGKLGLMEWELYKAVIDEGAERGLCAVKLQVRGESMLHPRFHDAVAYAKKAGVLDVQVTTNATLITEESAEKIIESGLDGIIFSVDAHHEHGFSERSEMKDYTQVRDAITVFLDTRAGMGSKTPWVRLQTALDYLTPQILRETKQNVMACYPLADLVVVNRIQNFREDEDVFPDLHQKYRQGPCDYLQHRLAVFWDGSVTVCCVDYNLRMKLGRFPEISIEDMWRSERLGRYRTMHRNGRRQDMPLCRRCHACASPISNDIGFDETCRHYCDYTCSER